MYCHIVYDWCDYFKGYSKYFLRKNLKGSEIAKYSVQFLHTLQAMPASLNYFFVSVS